MCKEADSTFGSDDLRSIVPRLTPDNLDADQVLVTPVKELAAGKNDAPARIALARVLAQKPWIAPIAGTTKMHRPEKNPGAADIELTAGELHDANGALEKIGISGDRYLAEFAKRVGR